MAGDEVVQVYVSDLGADVPVPIRALKAFKRVRILPSETKTVRFSIAPEAFSVIDEQNKRVIKPGIFEISAGGSQPKERAGVKEQGILKAGITIL
jgi:beta-glucosidase